MLSISLPQRQLNIELVMYAEPLRSPHKRSLLIHRRQIKLPHKLSNKFMHLDHR